jgi:hypothetical protein
VLIVSLAALAVGIAIFVPALVVKFFLLG